MLVREAVGAVLRTEREGCNMSLRDIAKVSGISLAYISEVERGLKDPSSEMLEAFADSVGLSMRELLVEAAMFYG